MTRGVSHPAELRAEVVAAVLAGMTMTQAAAQFKIDKSLVSRWMQAVATEPRVRDPETVGDLLYDLVAEHVEALRLQLQAASCPDWLAKQSAADVAQLVVAERDTLIRLLAGFRPAQPETLVLDAPSSSDPAEG